jgi:zinc transporter ZupT
MLIGIALAAFGATLAGGLLALRVARRLQWILGFSAGAVVAVAFFDLLPEALELSAATVPGVFRCTVFSMALGLGWPFRPPPRSA